VYDFLAGGGEMGELMRAHDWDATMLGAPDAWPEALKTTLRLLLGTNHPMLIWWGPQLFQFYNDAYLRTMDSSRHPRALGQPGPECWAEAWHIAGPQVEQVMAGQGATWNEDHLVPLTRNGELRDAWWTYSFSPIGNEAGVQGVLAICKDVTEEHENRARLEDLNRRLQEEVAIRERAEQALALERDRTRRQLQVEQQRSNRFLHNLKDGFVLMDRELRVLQVNAAGVALDGRPESGIVGRTHWELWPGPEHLEIGPRR
jgi:PAS domain-containing protein